MTALPNIRASCQYHCHISVSGEVQNRTFLCTEIRHATNILNYSVMHLFSKFHVSHYIDGYSFTAISTVTVVIAEGLGPLQELDLLVVFKRQSYKLFS